MTELLQRAISEIEKLPAKQQNEIAERILAELADDQSWTVSFNATTDQQWDRMAELVRQEIATGDTTELEEFLPSSVS